MAAAAAPPAVGERDLLAGDWAPDPEGGPRPAGGARALEARHRVVVDHNRGGHARCGGERKPAFAAADISKKDRHDATKRLRTHPSSLPVAREVNRSAAGPARAQPDKSGSGWWR